MSSTLATRPAPSPTRRRAADQPTARRTSGAGASVLGRADRPRLRIVADDDDALLVTRIPAEVVQPEILDSTPLRPIDLDDFYAADGRSVRLEVSAPVRLTRRGRLALTSLALVALTGLGVLAAQGAAAERSTAVVHTVTVEPGQTLWSISAGVASGRDSGDVRAAVREVRQLNHLASAHVTTGQRLRIPE